MNKVVSPFSGIKELAAEKTRNPISEYIRYSEFKRLLAQITTTLQKDGIKSIAVISELPGEGKSFFVSALALGWATLMNKRVLIVDTIEQTREQGLHFESLLDQADSKTSPSSLINLISTRGEGSQWSESTDFRIGEYINTLRGEYDVILFDTCAMSRANKSNMDPVVIARQADSAILVTSTASLQREIIAGTRERLKHWDVKLMGSVFNFGPTHG